MEISSSNRGQCIPYPEGEISKQLLSSPEALSSMGDTSFNRNRFVSPSIDITRNPSSNLISVISWNFFIAGVSVEIHPIAVQCTQNVHKLFFGSVFYLLVTYYTQKLLRGQSFLDLTNYLHSIVGVPESLLTPLTCFPVCRLIIAVSKHP